jgi:hypothetical protein
MKNTTIRLSDIYLIFFLIFLRYSNCENKYKKWIFFERQIRKKATVRRIKTIFMKIK